MFSNRKCAVLSLVLVLAADISAFKLYSVKDHDLIYKYRSELRVGVKNPKSFASQFVFSGDLHVRTNYKCGNSMGALLFVTDPKVYAYNGELDFDQFPEEFYFDDLNSDNFKMIPTCFRYDELGRLNIPDDERKVTFDERNWLRNIVSLFQINFDDLESDYKASIFTKTVMDEISFGACKTKYSIDIKDNEFMVRKTFNQLNCNHLAARRWSNVRTNYEKCNPLDNTNFIGQTDRIYHATKMESGEFMFVNITSMSGAILPLYENNGETHYEVTKQDLVFVKHKSIFDKTLGLTDEHGVEFEMPSIVSDDLKYSEFNQLDGKLSSKVTKLLKQWNQYLKEEDIRVHDKKFHNDQILNDIIDRMESMDVSEFRAVASNFQMLPQKEQTELNDLFLQIVPVAGTEQVMEYFEELLEKKQLSDNQILRFLISFPVHLDGSYKRNSSIFYQSIIERPTVSPMLKATAQLAFATDRSYYYENNEEDAQPMLDYFYDSLKTAKTFSDQLNALYAINNFPNKNVVKYLVPIIRGKDVLGAPYDWRLRQHAIYISENIFTEDEDVGMGALWLIMEDVSERPSLRMAALKVIATHTSDHAQIFRLYNLMKNEQNPQVYNYWYTMLKRPKTNLSCRDTIWTQAKWYSFDDRYADALSSANFYQHRESNLGYSTEMQLHIISGGDDNEPEDILLEVYHNFMHSSVRVQSIHLQIIETKSTYKMEVVMKFLDKAIITTNYKLNEFIAMNLAEAVAKWDMLMAIYGQYTYTNDLGFWTTVYSRIPNYLGISYDLTNPNQKFTIYFKEMIQACYGLYTINPMINAVHGVKRFITVDNDASVVASFSEGRVRFDSKQPKSILGTRVHVAKGVFFHPLNAFSVLQKTCPNCRKYVEAFDDELTFVNVELYRKELPDIGSELVFSLKNCQGYEQNAIVTSLDQFKIELDVINEDNLNDMFKTVLNQLYATSTCSMHIYLSSLPEVTSMAITGSYSKADQTVTLDNVVEFPTKKIEWVGKVHVDELDSHLEAAVSFVRNATDEEVSEHSIFMHFNRKSGSQFTYFGDIGGKKAEIILNAAPNMSSITHKPNQYYSECGNAKRSKWMTSNACLAAKTAVREYNANVAYKNLPESFLDGVETFTFWLTKVYGGSFVRQRSSLVNDNEIKMKLLFPIDKEAPLLTAEIETKHSKFALKEKAVVLTDMEFIFHLRSNQNISTCFIVPNDFVKNPNSTKIIKAVQKKNFKVFAGKSILDDASYEKIGQFLDTNVREIANHWEWAVAFKSDQTNAERTGPWLIYYNREFYTDAALPGLTVRDPNFIEMVEGVYWKPNDFITLYLSDEFNDIQTKPEYLVGDCQVNK